MNKCIITHHIGYVVRIDLVDVAVIHVHVLHVVTGTKVNKS